MPRNESPVDRMIRAGAAIVLAVVALVLGVGSVTGVVVLAVAAILAITAAVGFCPLYRLVGLSTVRDDRAPAR